MSRFECTIPLLRVDSLSRSLQFYEQALGMQRDWGADAANPGIASVSRDGCAIMLVQGAQGQAGTWLWIGVEDIRPLYTHLLTLSVPILLAPTNYVWALEMRVLDPDGHVLRIGSEPLSDQPFAV